MPTMSTHSNIDIQQLQSLASGATLLQNKFSKGNAELIILQTCKLLTAPFYILKVSNQGFSFPSKSSFLRLKHPLKIVVNLNCCDART